MLILKGINRKKVSGNDWCLTPAQFFESTFVQIYKIEENGQFRGGPSYYMEKALKKRWLGILFSIALIICFAYEFNGL